jgi:DNA-binding NtrC family response regulator
MVSDTPGFGSIIGRTEIMEEVIRRAINLAKSHCNIVITGETGTGKELLARAMHASSDRRERAFIPVNCRNLPVSFLESGIFGHEKGAFKGALRSQPGFLEYANGGTLFLCGVGSLSNDLQLKLVRVLETGHSKRFGGVGIRKVDVRFITASSTDLYDLVENGCVRDDLFFRLQTARLHLPSLKRRQEDIQPLAEHFMAECLKFSPKKIRGLSEETLLALRTYDWPGNIGELKDTIDQALKVAKGDWIQPSDLPVRITGCL